MSFIINLIFLGFVAIGASFALTKILIYLMPKCGIVDIPSKRRAHSKITPRGGGLSFVFIYSILLPAFEYFLVGSIADSILVLQIFLPISIVSFWDDVSHVIIPLRLFIHILCSTLAMMWLVHPSSILHYEMPVYIDLVIGIFALLTFLNIYNFMDGIDGITASQSLHFAATILLLCFVRYDLIPNVDMVIVTAVIIGGWSLGFICFNWSPAQIFLGDVGSISLGFLIGICLLVIASASAKLFAACVIASLYYISDGGMTIIIRIVKGERIWEPHLQHFFQKSIKKGKSHKRTVKRIMKCNIFLMCLAVQSIYYPVISIIGAILIVMVTIIRSVI
jgi:UDP-N-acetylmuramyl pentapeptide phosphotransferase/UDP-N-acetylglucosamine-1-phosphate transferase